MEKLTKDELELQNSIESNEWVSVPDTHNYKEIAKAQSKKDKRLSTRKSGSRLERQPGPLELTVK